MGFFDKFFDCLNVSNYVNGKHERKVFQDPYRSGSDFRLKVKKIASYLMPSMIDHACLKWLKDEFLPYLDTWEKGVAARKGFKKSQKNRMLLSAETRLGLQITSTLYAGTHV